MIRKRFSLLQIIIADITFSLAKCMKLLIVSWTIFILDLVLSYTDKLLVFRWVMGANCALLVSILL